MNDEADRLLDAIARLFVPAGRDAIQSILVVGTGSSAAVCRGLLSLFPGARLTAIDPDREALADLVAATLAGAPSEDALRLQTVTSVLIDLPDHAPSPYGLMIVRHPVITASRAAWGAALRACVHELGEGSTLIVTTESLPDAAFVDALMGSLSLAMLPGSPYTSVPVALTGEDQYILVYRHGPDN